MPGSRHAREGGFTLVEAMVAMVLVSTSLTGIYAWLNTDLISLRRAEAVIVSQDLAREVIHRLGLLPLASGQYGDFDLGDYQVRWESRLVEPTAKGRTQRGSLGLYDLSLYEVSFEIYSGESSLGDWVVRELRYIKVRSLEYE